MNGYMFDLEGNRVYKNVTMEERLSRSRTEEYRISREEVF